MNETAKKALVNLIEVKTKFNAEAQHRINDLTNDLAGWQESFDQCERDIADLRSAINE